MGPGVSDLFSPRYPNGMSDPKFTLRFRPHADDQGNWQVGHTKTILLFHICTVVGEVASRNRREKIPSDEWVIYFSLFYKDQYIVAKPGISDQQIGQGHGRVRLGIRLGSTFPAIIHELQVPESRSRHNCQNHQR